MVYATNNYQYLQVDIGMPLYTYIIPKTTIAVIVAFWFYAIFIIFFIILFQDKNWGPHTKVFSKLPDIFVVTYDICYI